MVQHGPGERTFHFFYYLFAGLEKESLEYFSLDNPENYRYENYLGASISNEENLFRILKDPCGGKVFPNRADFKHCRQMFNTQKEIMQRVGFTKQVNKSDERDGYFLPSRLIGYQYGLHYSRCHSSFDEYSIST